MLKKISVALCASEIFFIFVSEKSAARHPERNIPELIFSR